MREPREIRLRPHGRSARWRSVPRRRTHRGAAGTARSCSGSRSTSPWGGPVINLPSSPGGQTGDEDEVPEGQAAPEDAPDPSMPSRRRWRHQSPKGPRRRRRRRSRPSRCRRPTSWSSPLRRLTRRSRRHRRRLQSTLRSRSPHRRRQRRSRHRACRPTPCWPRRTRRRSSRCASARGRLPAGPDPHRRVRGRRLKRRRTWFRRRVRSVAWCACEPRPTVDGTWSVPAIRCGRSRSARSATIARHPGCPPRSVRCGTSTGRRSVPGDPDVLPVGITITMTKERA